MEVHFGFSYVGLIFLLMLTIPNIVWSFFLWNHKKELDREGNGAE